MTEVTSTVSAPPVSVKTHSENTDTHPRLADYKARSIRCSQEERRINLLLEQKHKRSESFNTSRGLIEAITENEDMEEKDEVEMEWNEIEKVKNASGYFDKLMFSEWLIEVPSNLEDSWYMVPCPKGNRTMIVATRGQTKAYNKYGCFKSSFQSVLPGGRGRRNGTRGYTILDCIWHGPSRTYYILDVLTWNNQSFLECETEFRFFWLQTKIQETEGISEKSELNDIPFILLPHYRSDRETLTTIMAMDPPFPDENVALDGVLFYHIHCHYRPGTTPLVGWLKPFMLPEILGIPVGDSYLASKPPDYENLQSHIEKTSESQKNMKWYRKKSKRRSKHKEEKMDVSLNDEEKAEEEEPLNEPINVV